MTPEHLDASKRACLPERAIITHIAELPYGVLEIETNSGSVWCLRVADKVWTLQQPPRACLDG